MNIKDLAEREAQRVAKAEHDLYKLCVAMGFTYEEARNEARNIALTTFRCYAEALDDMWYRLTEEFNK